jgi:hypothetical protein
VVPQFNVRLVSTLTGTVNISLLQIPVHNSHLLSVPDGTNCTIQHNAYQRDSKLDHFSLYFTKGKGKGKCKGKAFPLYT